MKPLRQVPPLRFNNANGFMTNTVQPIPNVKINPDNGNIEITGNPGDPSLNFLITNPTNSDLSNVIDGWEFSIQHFFGESGFGIQANYTMVDAGTAMITLT